MQKDNNYNHHAKCENVALIILNLADDVLLFCWRDLKSIEMMLENVQDFSISTDYIVNPSKFKFYFGGIDYELKKVLKEVITFEEG